MRTKMTPFRIVLLLACILWIASDRVVVASPIDLTLHTRRKDSDRVYRPRGLLPLGLVARGEGDPVVNLHHSASPTHSSQPSSTPTPTNPPTNSSGNGSGNVPIYGADSITPQMGVAGAIFIVLGIYLMVFGFRSFRLTLAVGGFITFGAITWIGMANSEPPDGYVNNDITLIAVPAGLGVLGAILYGFFWNISIYLMGGLSGLAFGLFVCCWREDLVITQNVARACFLVALSFLMVCLTFFVERYIILFAVSFVGAYAFILGVDLLAHTGYLAGIISIVDRNPLHHVEYDITRKVIALMAMTIVLFLFALGWQFFYNRNREFGVNVEPVKPKPNEGGEPVAPAPADPPPSAPASGSDKTEVEKKA